jgi:hypothetical protein
MEKFHLRMKDCDPEPEEACSPRQEIKAFGWKMARKVKIDTNL